MAITYRQLLERIRALPEAEAKRVLSRDGRWVWHYREAIRLETAAAKTEGPVEVAPRLDVVRTNLARPPGPIPTMDQVSDAIGLLSRAIGQGRHMRPDLADICDLIRRAPLYIGDERARILATVEKAMGRPPRAVWITADGRELIFEARHDDARELRDTPYGWPDGSGW